MATSGSFENMPRLHDSWARADKEPDPRTPASQPRTGTTSWGAGPGAALPPRHGGLSPTVCAGPEGLTDSHSVDRTALAPSGDEKGEAQRWVVAGTLLVGVLAAVGAMVWRGLIPSPLRALWEGGLSAAFHTYSTSATFWTVLAGSFVATVCLTPLTMVLARKVGAVDHGGHRKVCQTEMPLLGGLAVALPFFGCCLLGLIGPTDLLRQVSDKHMELLAILIGGMGCVFVGLVDDIHGMRVRHKFLLQIALALFVCFCGFTIRSLTVPFLGTVTLGPVIGAGLTILWIVGLTNAVNIVDGLDGLASGIALIAATGLGLIAAINGSVFVALLCATLVGSLAAFLLFNFHPARIFLGDTGSLFLGFALATISLTGSMKRSGTVIFLAPLLALGLPIFEVALSMLRRYLQGLPISCADARHIHHCLLKRGLSQRRAVLILYAAALVCMLAALFSFTNASDKEMAILLPLGMYALVMLTVGWLAGYSCDFRALSLVRKRNLFFQTVVSYVTRSLSSDIGALDPDALLGIVRAEMRLTYLCVSFVDTQERVGVSGAPAAESDGPTPSEPVQEIRVKSPNGLHVQIRYQFCACTEKSERIEIQRHLGRIFEYATINRANLPHAADGQSSVSALQGVRKNTAPVRAVTVPSVTASVPNRL